MTVEETISVLSKARLPLQNEKILQAEIAKIIPEFIPERRLAGCLGTLGIIDFYHLRNSIGVEVKIKGGRKAIYRQCEQYCRSYEISSLILVTNRAMGLPPEIHGKPCYVVNLGKAWL